MLSKQHFWELYQCNFCDLLVNQMLRYKFFPKYIEINHQIESILQCFYQVEEVINSQKNNFSSNKVLSLLRPYLIEADMIVEEGKGKKQKIRVPVLFGLTNEEDKYFEPDALSTDCRIVIEVEAGRAVDNNQFLKDIFKASMMLEVEYLVMAVRNNYRGKDDFKKICDYLETLYASNRITLPLKAILIIGY